MAGKTISEMTCTVTFGTFNSTLSVSQFLVLYATVSLSVMGKSELRCDLNRDFTATAIRLYQANI